MSQKHGMPSGDDSSSTRAVVPATTPHAPAGDLTSTSGESSCKSQVTENTQLVAGPAETPVNKASAFTNSREFEEGSSGVTVPEPEPHLVVCDLHRSIVASNTWKDFNKLLLEQLGSTFADKQKQQCKGISARPAQCAKILEIWTLQASPLTPRLVTDLIILLENLKLQLPAEKQCKIDETVEKLRLTISESGS